MSKYWKMQNRIMCPYYLGERDKCIVCEGIIAEKQQSYFQTTEDKHIHKVNYCTKYPNGCPIFATLEEQNEKR